jgi:hypothetical protein
MDQSRTMIGLQTAATSMSFSAEIMLNLYRTLEPVLEREVINSKFL